MATVSIFCRRIPLPVFSRRRESGLNQSLGLLNLSLLGITGSNFVLLTSIGVLVKNITGASAFLSCIVAAIFSLFPGLCYIEFATKMPSCGSVYTYTYAAIGESAAFLVGINNLCDIMCQVAMMGKTFSAFCQHWISAAVGNASSFQLYTPTDNSTGGFTFFEAHPDWVAGLQLLIISLLLIFSVHISASIFNGLGTVFLVGFLVITISSFVYGSPANLTSTGGSIFKHGFSGVMNGATIAVVAFSFIDVYAVATEESARPEVDMPRAVVIGMSVVTFFLILATIAVAYLCPNSAVDAAIPLLTGFVNLDITWAVVLVFVIATIALISSSLVGLQVASRYLFNIAKDGLLPAFVAYLQPTFKSPIVAVAIVTTISILLAMFLSLVLLISIMQFGIVLSFLAIGVDLLIVRYMPFCSPDAEIRDRLMIRPSLSRFVREDDRSSWMTKPAFFLILVVTEVTCIGFSVIIFSASTKDHNPILIYSSGTIFCAIAVAIFLVMSMYQPNPVPVDTEGVTIPLQPLPSVITIILSLVLMSRISFLGWCRFIIVSALGMVFYSIYRLLTLYREKKREYETISDSTEDNEYAMSRGTVRKTL